MKLLRLVSSILLAIAAPAFATVTVTSPKAGSTVTSPVQYAATATASTCSKGVASIGIYVNNKKVYDVSGAKLSTSLTLATGSQHTVVEEWDKCGAATYTTVNLTVAAKPTVTISANPTSIKFGSSSTLTVKATNSTNVTLSGTDGSTYTFATTGGTHAVSPKATTTYTVTATGASGATATATAKVTVTAPPAPTAAITATPTSIKAGATSTLKVTATNATTVTIAGSDGSSYTLSATGGSQAVSPTSTTSYTATATGPSGVIATAKTTVTVTAAPAPTATITATPTSIKAGSSSTLKVTATNATTVIITGSDGSSYTLSATGGSQAVSPTSTTTYTAKATASGGATASAAATVTVTAAPAPTATITATPTSITSGASSTLKVTATNATTVTLTGSDSSSYTLSATGGSQVVSPSSTTTYTAKATASGGATASATATVTVTAAPAPTVSISASPTSVAAGNSSTLTVSASNATTVTITGTDSSSYTLSSTGGKQVVTPASTTTYTATATGAGSTTATANATVTVGAKALTSITVGPNQTSFAMGTTQNFTATANYSDGSTSNVTSTATWSAANTAVATIDQTGLATGQAAGSTTVAASLNGVTGNTPVTVTIAPGTGVNILTWHGDTYRSGLNNSEQSLTTNNVSAQNFGKLFSLSVNGYPYAQPLIVSGLSIKGGTHNVLYVATETNDVYAFDADNGAQLWHVTTMFSGESPDNVSSGAIFPTIGITGTPVIDTSTNTMYVVSKQGGNGKGNFFRLSALDITTGAQKPNSPVTITASIPTTETSEFPSGFQTLTTSCIQRTALLEAYGNVYFGFGSCHSGWMLAYDTQTLQQTGYFNSSPNMDGEGQWASAGGVWMGGGGPASNGNDGYVYITTGNGPWDGVTAFSDSILQFNPPTLSSSSPIAMNPSSYFTPQDYQYMDCSDGDLAAGGLLLIPGTTEALAGAKTARMYLVDTTNLGGMQANDTGALDTLLFESDLSPSFSKTCSDSTVSFGTVNHTIQGSHYEIYSTGAYFNGSVYQGITAEASNIPAGLRQFTLSGGQLTPSTYTAYGNDQEIRGTTPFISANGTSDGVVWMIDQNEPLGASGYAPGIAVLRAFDPNNLGAPELYDSNVNQGDQPGYGIKFTSPIVANGKVYIATGTTLESNSTQTGEIDVYGLN